MAAQHPSTGEPLTGLCLPVRRIPQLLLGLLIALALSLPTAAVQADAPPPTAAAPAAPAACDESPGCPLPADADHALVDPIWWNENKINQINPETYETASALLSNPYNTCGPTTLALVINYIYALRGPEAPAWVSPTQVMEAARGLGFYEPPDNDGWMSADDLRAIAGQFGLKQVFPKGGSTFLPYESLFNELKKGFPAIVGMRYAYDKATWEYRPVGDDSPLNHFVIIFGITDDGNYFWLLNTHPGAWKQDNSEVSLKLIPFDAFKAAWAQNDGSALTDYGVAIFLR